MGALVWLAALGCGIALAPLGPFSWWLLLVPSGLAVAAWATGRAKAIQFSVVFAFFLALGYLLCRLALIPPSEPDHVLRWVERGDVTVEGDVLSLSRRHDGGGRLDLEARRLWLDGQGQVVRGRVRLYLQSLEGEVLPGDRLRFRAPLRRVRNFGTPGEFDFSRYLAGRDVWTTAFVSCLDDVALFPAATGGAPREALGRLRHRIGSFLAGALPAETSALLASLLIGDKDGLSPDQRKVLAAGGISHLFSISGLHLGLIGFYAYHLLLILWRRSEYLLLHWPPRRYLPLAVLPLLLAYLWLTGEALPTRRALFMAAVGALLWLGSRRSDPLHLLAAAAFLFLLFEPLQLFEASFQLSFAGVAGIVLLVPPLARHVPGRPRLLRWFLLLGLTTLAATLATLPLTLLHFHTLAPAGLITNFVAVPVVGMLALPLGLAALALMPLWPAAAVALVGLAGAAVDAVLALTRWLVLSPLLAGRTCFLTPLELAAVALLVVLLCLPGWSGRRLWMRGVVASGCALLLVCSPPNRSDLRVTALSVGQGEAMLLSLGRDRHILVDGGGLYSDSFDVGERLVAPALGRLGVRKLEAVVLTHDHPDHRKGLKYILENFPVGQFWVSSGANLPVQDLGEVLALRGIPVRHFEPDWTLVEANSPWNLAVFQADGTNLGENDRSLVLFAGLGDEGVLLTGDLEREGVKELLLHPPQGRVSLLKLPHHGSRHSVPERLFERFSPAAVFACAGYRNRHRLPSPAVVEDLAARGVPLWRTDLQGSLRFMTTGYRWSAQTWRGGMWR